MTDMGYSYVATLLPNGEVLVKVLWNGTGDLTTVATLSMTLSQAAGLAVALFDAIGSRALVDSVRKEP